MTSENVENLEIYLEDMNVSTRFYKYFQQILHVFSFLTLEIIHFSAGCYFGVSSFRKRMEGKIFAPQSVIKVDI